MESSKTVGITEVVLRDGIQSLLATRVPLRDLVSILPTLDNVGYWSLETWGGATYDSCIRYLNEDPWERLRTFNSLLENTPQQMLIRGQNLVGYKHYSNRVVSNFLEKSAENGIEIFRTFDALNDFENIDFTIREVKRIGKHAQGTIAYTTSPVHDLNTWLDLAKKIEDAGADSLAIKDMAGLLRPFDAYELVKNLKCTLSIPIHMQTHATTGMSTATNMKAIEAGIDNIDTSISSLSMTYGHTPTETLISILDGTNRETGLNIEKLTPIAEHFQKVRKKYKNFEGSLRGVDARILASQVPGGMLTNLENQLKAQDSIERFDEVIHEIPKVREDLGFIPLVTPTSQIVGTQSVINILSGSRYSTVTNEVKSLLKGEYGATPAPVNKDLQQEGIGDSAVITCRPADLLSDDFQSVEEEFKNAIAEKNITVDPSIENVLIYAMFPEIGLSYIENSDNPEFFESEPIEINELTDSSYLVTVDDQEYSVTLKADNSVIINDGSSINEVASSPSVATVPGTVIEAPLGGNIFRTIISEGEAVDADTTVLILEAMKMETEIKAPSAGVIGKIFVKPGDTVKPGNPLFEIKS